MTGAFCSPCGFTSRRDRGLAHARGVRRGSCKMCGDCGACDVKRRGKPQVVGPGLSARAPEPYSPGNFVRCQRGFASGGRVFGA